MRETRNAQTSRFDFYAPHALGDQLNSLSDVCSMSIRLS